MKKSSKNKYFTSYFFLFLQQYWTIKIRIDSIKEEVENAYKTEYDHFKKHSVENNLSLPEDKIRKGAQLMMQSKMNEKMEEINLLFPYLK